MIDKQFVEMDNVEDTHFWHVARREIILSTMQRVNILKTEYSVLEIGAGTGANLKFFKSYFNDIQGVEINEEAITLAKKKLPDVEINKGSLPYEIGFNGRKFDLIFLFDVLEHVDDDLAALEEIKKKLNPDGSLIITVPAFQFLFGAHDKSLFHFRRYNKQNLSKKLIASGYKIKFLSYFNFWLFPIVLISRLFEKFTLKSSGYALKDPSSSIVNKLFYKIMRNEKKILGKGIKLPFGSSIIVVTTI